MIKNNPQFL